MTREDVMAIARLIGALLFGGFVTVCVIFSVYSFWEWFS